MSAHARAAVAGTPRYASVVFDVDSTLTSLEGVDWLATLRGDAIARQITALTNQAMGGTIPLESVYARRLDVIRPTRAEIAALGQAYCDAVQPGARALCAVLAAADVAVSIMSGGLRDAILPLAEYLGVAHVHAVSVQFDNADRYCALDGAQPLTTQRGKPAVLHALALARPSVMIGDGATDAAVRGVADAFIAYTGVTRRPAVVAVADAEAANFATLHRLLLHLDS